MWPEIPPFRAIFPAPAGGAQPVFGGGASDAFVSLLTADLKALSPPTVIGIDFDGDGNRDILWRNHTTGDVAIWLMNGTSISSGAIVANVSLDWDIAGTGDFNNDGKADILWRNHTTGDVAIWLMNGTSISSGAIVANVSLDWDIAGTGDFNNDGKADILWRNHTTGDVAIWLMNGTFYQQRGHSG